MALPIQQTQSEWQVIKGGKNKVINIEKTERPSAYTSHEISKPKAQAAEPIRTIEDYHKIVNYFLDNNQYRNAMLVVVGVLLGERCGDLLSIKFGDIMQSKDIYKSQFRIWEEKTHKWSQYMTLPEEAKTAIDLYISSLEDYTLDDYLFASRKGEQLTVGSAHKILKNMSRDLQLPYNVGTHTLRKTFGWFARIANPNTNVMEMLQIKYNHVDMRTTMRYMSVTKEELFNLQNSISGLLK